MPAHCVRNSLARTGAVARWWPSQRRKSSAKFRRTVARKGRRCAKAPATTF